MEENNKSDQKMYYRMLGSTGLQHKIDIKQIFTLFLKYGGCAVSDCEELGGYSQKMIKPLYMF